MPQPIAATNDFVVKFANVNGSGSASANELFAKCIIRMGVPVASRNIFPSNIQGLPTWYEVRVSGDGWIGRRGGVDLMVAMNPQTWTKDVDSIDPGGYLFYDSTKPLTTQHLRDDMNLIGVPLTSLSNTMESVTPRERQLLKNMIYLGALTALLGIERQVVEGKIAEQYAKAARADPCQHGSAEPGLRLRDRQSGGCLQAEDRARRRGGRPHFHRRQRCRRTGRGLWRGDACARGIRSRRPPRWRKPSPSIASASASIRKPGERRYAIVQAEDEIAAIGMVIGAGWNGARAFTATSGPGISLMQEFIGLAYFAEIPAVIFDIQRGGPSTGMPTRTQQSDILTCAYASHGDTKHVLLLPKDPGESFHFAADAFDLAERLQTPIFVMMDLDIGMNDWLTKPLDLGRQHAPMTAAR